MTPDELRRRTKRFALDIIRVAERLPRSRTADVLGRQVIRCGTSVGANYRPACRARSAADFINKLGIVEEEADEVIYWLELLVEAGLVPGEAVTAVRDEAEEILSMVVASIRTARANSTRRENGATAVRIRG